MGRPKGLGKTPGSGRKPGTLNKKTEDLQSLAEEMGVHPFKILLQFASGNWKDLGYEDEYDLKYTQQGEPYKVRVIQPETRVKAASEAAQYLYAKRKQIEIIPEDNGGGGGPQPKKTFIEFCQAANYPTPFPKQSEMMEFGINTQGSRMILGSRGYGKTDYVVILGVAYKLYLDPSFTVLIITKSEQRNAAMLQEISKSLQANGVALEKENAGCLRLLGLLGKDHSVSAVPIGTNSLRGRHPKMVIMDDPVTDEDVSEATRTKVQRVYNEINKLCQHILIIGQPVHKYDLYQSLRPCLNKMEVPHGSIPELDHDLEAQRLAGVDEASIQASYFLNVQDSSATPFDKVKYMDTFPSGGTCVAFIDPSDGGNDTALSIFRMFGQAMAVVGFSWKRSWHHCLDDMEPIFKKYGVSKVCFETNKHGEQPIDLLRSSFKNIGVVGRYSNGNKHSRIMAAGTLAHLIHLSKESHKNYIDQVVKYEMGAKIDDAPDSLATGLEWIGVIKGKQ
jgi:hypothetical protein